MTDAPGGNVCRLYLRDGASAHAVRAVAGAGLPGRCVMSTLTRAHRRKIHESAPLSTEA